jgi:hypothetical protein
MEELLKGPYEEGQTIWREITGQDGLLRWCLHFGTSLPYGDYLSHTPRGQSTPLRGKSRTKQDKKKSGVAAPLWMY